MRKSVELWCDGACIGNPGPGGWAAILRYNGKNKELSGGEPDTTNNRMELQAVIEGLRAITEPVLVEVVVDSAYVESGFTKGWVANWKKNGWKLRGGGDVKNRDLWEQLDQEVARHLQVTWRRVKGHSGITLNERCDELATRAASKARGQSVRGGWDDLHRRIEAAAARNAA